MGMGFNWDQVLRKWVTKVNIEIDSVVSKCKILA